MLNFCDFIQVFVFTTNHHLNIMSVETVVTGYNSSSIKELDLCKISAT